MMNFAGRGAGRHQRRARRHNLRARRRYFETRRLNADTRRLGLAVWGISDASIKFVRAVV
jgi:hypothetical protein